MRKREEYHSKVTVDTGLTRGRVPAPLLKEMGARAGDRLLFRLEQMGKVEVRLARTKKRPSRKRR